MAGEENTRLTVNGSVVNVDVDPETPLMFVLRWDLGLRGVRCGCGIGFCGACTVLVDKSPVSSCITPLSAVAGSSVVTPEGLGTPDAPGHVQQVFLDEQAGQCGYCLNGIIMAVAAAVDQGCSAERELRDKLSAHVCRCCTHTRILRAARRVARESESSPSCHVLEGAFTPQASPPCPETRLATPEPTGCADGGQATGRVESRLSLLPDGRVEIRPGKVELGQGILTAMSQIAASQIGLPVERIVVRPAQTGSAPDEGNTSGSQSVDHGGAAMAIAAAAFRRLLLDRAAAELATKPAELRLESHRVVSTSGPSISLATLAAADPITGDITTDDRVDWNAPPLGREVPREDLRRKLTGAAAFIHDLMLPGMLHARPLLPPVYNATVEQSDIAAAESMPGVVRVIRQERLLIVVAEREEQAIRAASRLRRATSWNAPSLVEDTDIFTTYRNSPAESYVARRAQAHAVAVRTSREATYTQPYQSHGPAAPSCAIAQSDGDGIRIWTHSQGIFALRRELSKLLEVDPGSLEVLHLEGPGCYGQTLADDAAAFAIVAAKELHGRPVRFQFSVQDEFMWDPFGPAMLADLNASVDHNGQVTRWSHRTRTDTHTSRPQGTGNALIPAWLRREGARARWRGATNAGARNAVPMYDIPDIEAVADHVRGPLRTGTLRSLGSYLNTFAAESFVDEVAEAANMDAVEFRLAHLRDERARRVLEVAADAVDWTPHVGPSGRGLGLALCRYKGSKAFVVQAVQADVDPDSALINVTTVVTVCDAGAVVNPDGLRNQLEGGTLQGLSRAIYEEVRYDRSGVLTCDWSSYPVLEFSDVPNLKVILVDAPADAPPLGVGEAATPPVPAALANAIDDAKGVRLRDLPFTPDRIRQRLYTMTDAELERVLV